MEIKFGFLQTKVTTEEEKCKAANCARIMRTDDDCFIDVQSNAVFCDECGKCERYSRKKEQERIRAGITETPLIKGLDY